MLADAVTPGKRAAIFAELLRISHNQKPVTHRV
jgi:hypothetical protein